MKIDLLPNHFELLHDYSESSKYEKFSTEELELFRNLKSLETKFNFPAVKNDVGVFISFLANLISAKKIFEFGSGYGQSAFWFLKNCPNLQTIVLTEKREDFFKVFEQLDWPITWREKIHYHNADAEVIIKDHLDSDLFFFDGEKSLYIEMLVRLETSIKPNAVVVIDNAFWKGSFLTAHPQVTKKSSESIDKLHQYLKISEFWQTSFLPFLDGVLILKKKEL